MRPMAPIICFALLALTMPERGAAATYDPSPEHRQATTPLNPALLLVPECTGAMREAGQREMCNAFADRLSALVAARGGRDIEIVRYNPRQQMRDFPFNGKEKYSIPAEALKDKAFVLAFRVPEINTFGYNEPGVGRVYSKSSLINVKAFLNDGEFTPFGYGGVSEIHGERAPTELTVPAVQKAAESFFVGLTQQRCKSMAIKCEGTFSVAFPSEKRPTFTVVP